MIIITIIILIVIILASYMIKDTIPVVEWHLVMKSFLLLENSRYRASS